MLTEEEIRKRVKTLKRFYMDLVVYTVVNVLLILIWLTLDRSWDFWPKYVIVIWGFALAFRACQLGLMPFVFQYIFFLKPEWEERKVEELTGRRRFSQRKVLLKRDMKK